VNCFLGDLSLVEPVQYITLRTYTAYLWLRGSIYVKSIDVDSRYSFDTGFLSHLSDVKTQV
jgi:hypothetical protein